MPSSSPFFLLLTLSASCFQLPPSWLSSWLELKQLSGLEKLQCSLDLVCFTCISHSCSDPLFPNHSKVNLLFHNWLFPRPPQFINLFTHEDTSTICGVSPLCQALLCFGVTKSWPSKHLCSGGNVVLRQLQVYLCATWGKHRRLLGHRGWTPYPALWWESEGRLPGGDDSRAKS